MIAVREFDEATPVGEESSVRYEVLVRPTSPDGRTAIRVCSAHAEYPDLSLRAPAYQAPNAATAIAAAEAFLGRALDAGAAGHAFEAAKLPGRFEVLAPSPPLVIDGAHNPQAALVLAEAIRDAWPDPLARPVVLLGILSDKDASGIVAALAPVAREIAVTISRSPRALAAEELAAITRAITGNRPQVFETVDEALEALVPASPSGLVVSGSITTAAEARAWARARSTTA